MAFRNRKIQPLEKYKDKGHTYGANSSFTGANKEECRAEITKDLQQEFDCIQEIAAIYDKHKFKNYVTDFRPRCYHLLGFISEPKYTETREHLIKGVLNKLLEWCQQNEDKTKALKADVKEGLSEIVDDAQKCGIVKDICSELAKYDIIASKTKRPRSLF